jgi:Skp family chaperone for outer membrane proteins
VKYRTTSTIALTALTAVLLLGGCGTSSPIGLVDVQRIVANWPEYQSYQNQLLVDERSIAAGRGNRAQKLRATTAMQQKYTKITEQLTQQIRDASSKIAQQKRLQLVLTREGVGYGGVDITADVEKSLNITEKATPTPGM